MPHAVRASCDVTLLSGRHPYQAHRPNRPGEHARWLDSAVDASGSVHETARAAAQPARCHALPALSLACTGRASPWPPESTWATATRYCATSSTSRAGASRTSSASPSLPRWPLCFRCCSSATGGSRCAPGPRHAGLDRLGPPGPGGAVASRGRLHRRKPDVHVERCGTRRLVVRLRPAVRHPRPDDGSDLVVCKTPPDGGAHGAEGGLRHAMA